MYWLRIFFERFRKAEIDKMREREERKLSFEIGVVTRENIIQNNVGQWEMTKMQQHESYTNFPALL